MLIVKSILLLIFIVWGGAKEKINRGRVYPIEPVYNNDDQVVKRKDSEDRFKKHKLI